MKHNPLKDLNGMPISDTAIRQPVFITMIIAFLVVVGILSFNTLPVDQLPEISPPVIFVGVGYPGAGPESVADQVALPLEDELSTLNGVSRIQTDSSEGRLQLVIEFEQDIDPDLALQEVRERVGLVRPRLPDEINEPTFRRFDPALQPILTLAITSDAGRSPQELRDLIENEIVPLVQPVAGVGSIEIAGGLVRQINVNMDENRLTAFSVLPSTVTAVVRNATNNTGLGDINIANLDVNLRSPSAVEVPSDIARLGIPGTIYTVGDVATVEDGFEEIENFTRLNGDDSISLEIQKQSGTNTVAVADGALAQIDESFTEYPDLSYVIVRDSAAEVRTNVNGAVEEIIFAVIFALLVVFFFFRDVRATLVTGSGLPVVIIGTFAGIALLGFTINVMTLLALSVCVGLVIDDAIVVRENIFRYTERGFDPKIAASKGVAEVSLAVVAMTLTIIAVFMPVAFTSGVAGIIFGSFGLTIVAAMLISLLESFTLAPMLSAYFIKRKKNVQPTDELEDPDEVAEAQEEVKKVGWLGTSYARVLGWSLRHRWAIVLLAFAIVGVSVWAAGGVRTAFFPQNDSGEFGVGFEMPPGTPLEQTDALAREAEQIILDDPAVAYVLSTVGAAGTSERTEFFVKLRDEDEVGFFEQFFDPPEPITTADTQARLREQLPEARFPEIAFAQPGFQGTNTQVTSRPIQARVLTSGDLDDLAPVVAEMEQAIQGIEGLRDIDTTYTPGAPEIQLVLQPEVAADYGVSNNDIATTVRTLVDGQVAGTYRDDGEDYDILVRMARAELDSFGTISSLRIPLNGEMVPLVSVADVQLDSSPTTIRRTDRETEIIIGGNNVGRNINEVQAEVQAALLAVETPDNVRVVFGGDTEDQAESFITILVAMGLSVVFVYMVLASQFGSFLQPFVIMLAMPLSFLGAFMALRLTGIELDIFGMIGMVLLLGLVTKNSILLVDFINRLSASGVPKNDAITSAGAIRLRPILMTAIAILMANLPAAMGLGEGSELRQGLATIVIGGLVTSTLLTLVFVPVAYSLLESVLRRLGQAGRWVGRKLSRSHTDDSGNEREPDSDTEGSVRAGTGSGSTTGGDGRPGVATFHVDAPGDSAAPYRTPTAPDENERGPNTSSGIAGK